MSNPIVTLETTFGNIKIELFAEEAPNTVQNFLNYVDSEFYNGTIFHRVIPGFMVQGGGFTADIEQKTTNEPIEHEGKAELRNLRGTIAMARTSNPHSATAQFFINSVDNDFLNFSAPAGNAWGYAVFGKVIDGMDVVDEISAVPTGIARGMRDVPRSTVEIKKASLSPVS